MAETTLMTNKLFALKDKVFRAACKLVIVGKNKDGSPKTLPPTQRQASKYRNYKGLAYLKRREAQNASKS